MHHEIGESNYVLKNRWTAEQEPVFFQFKHYFPYRFLLKQMEKPSFPSKLREKQKVMKNMKEVVEIVQVDMENQNTATLIAELQAMPAENLLCRCRFPTAKLAELLQPKLEKARMVVEKEANHHLNFHDSMNLKLKSFKQKINKKIIKIKKNVKKNISKIFYKDIDADELREKK